MEEAKPKDLRILRQERDKCQILASIFTDQTNALTSAIQNLGEETMDGKDKENLYNLLVQEAKKVGLTDKGELTEEDIKQLLADAKTLHGVNERWKLLDNLPRDMVSEPALISINQWLQDISDLWEDHDFLPGSEKRLADRIQLLSDHIEREHEIVKVKGDLDKVVQHAEAFPHDSVTPENLSEYLNSRKGKKGSNWKSMTAIGGGIAAIILVAAVSVTVLWPRPESISEDLRQQRDAAIQAMEAN